jgi:hypothetical protein
MVDKRISTDGITNQLGLATYGAVGTFVVCTGLVLASSLKFWRYYEAWELSYSMAWDRYRMLAASGRVTRTRTTYGAVVTDRNVDVMTPIIEDTEDTDQEDTASEEEIIVLKTVFNDN